MAKPKYDKYTETYESSDPILKSDIYHESWKVISLDQREIDNNIRIAKQYKYSDIDTHMDSLLNEAYSNPYKNKHVSPERTKKSKEHQLQKVIYGESISDIDYQRGKVLTKFEEGVLEVNDIIYSMIESMSNASNIYAVNVEIASNWPVWTPPA